MRQRHIVRTSCSAPTEVQTNQGMRVESYLCVASVCGLLSSLDLLLVRFQTIPPLVQCCPGCRNVSRLIQIPLLAVHQLLGLTYSRPLPKLYTQQSMISCKHSELVSVTVYRTPAMMVKSIAY